MHDFLVLPSSGCLYVDMVSMDAPLFFFSGCAFMHGACCNLNTTDSH